jgi:NAD(P)-dependent dehydrogenase (short-subunit alcohol dehydrogenase family)
MTAGIEPKATDSLAGKRVLVTGGTGNVGWGIAVAAQEAGAALVLTTRSSTGALSLQEEFPEATVVTADLGTAKGEADLTKALSSLGSLDHVAAPIGAWWQKGASLDQNPTELDELLVTYAGSQLRLLHATAPLLRSSKGSYTMVTGVGGENLIPGAGLLVVAVRSQFALADVLMNELRDDALRFNEVRIAGRIEKVARPGVIPSVEAAPLLSRL